jgi:radical SAM protein with 4Fe4S-binding SPASM domain
MIETDEVDIKCRKLIDNFQPFNAALEVTGRCNAQCGYCYILREPPCADLSTEAIFRIIDKIDETGIFFVCITGGEPFIREDILDILSYLIKKDFFRFCILTNGTLLTDEHIDFLVKNKNHVDFLRMSLFSHIDTIHDGYCGVENGLAKSIANAEKLMAGGVKVLGIMNILDINIDSFEQSWHYFSRMGFDMTIGLTKCASQESYETTARPFTSKEFYTRIFSRMDPAMTSSFIESLDRRLSEPEKNPGICSGLSNSISIDYRGNVKPCLTFRNMVIGNALGEKGLLDILRSSEDYRKLRSMNKNNIDKCRECGFINFCDVCLGMLHSLHGKFNENPEQFCNFAHALNDFRIDQCSPNIFQRQ